jgi:DNA repair exonuclease SbcCD ATPase subunit
MSSPINKIELNNFRGASKATVIEFNPEKNIIVMFGENGTGKSSIVDAIDMIGNESPGSLGLKPSTSIKQHLPTIGKTHNDLYITLYAGDSDWTGRLSGSKVNVSGHDEAPIVHVLRRSQLLSLIEAQPAKRYDALRRLLDVAGVERAEQELRNATTAANTESTSLSQQLRDSSANLCQLWKDEGAHDESAIKWAEKKATADQSGLQKDSEQLIAIITNLEGAIAAKSTFDEALTNYKHKEEAYNRINEEVAESPGLNAKEAIGLLNVLRKTQSYISMPDTPSDKCPVCEQPVKIEALRQSISDRLSRMTKLEELDNKQKRATSDLKSSKSTKETQLLAYISSLTSIVEDSKQTEIEEIVELKVDWSKYTELNNEHLENKRRCELASELFEKLNPLLAKLKPQQSNIQKDIHQHNAIKRCYDDIIACQKKKIKRVCKINCVNGCRKC